MDGIEYAPAASRRGKKSGWRRRLWGKCCRPGQKSKLKRKEKEKAEVKRIQKRSAGEMRRTAVVPSEEADRKYKKSMGPGMGKKCRS